MSRNSSTRKPIPAEETLFSTLYGIIVGFALVRLNIFAPIEYLILFSLTLIIAVDFYLQWYLYYSNFPSRSLKWIFIHMLMSIVIFNLFFYINYPTRYCILLAMYWVVDLLWCARAYVEYRNELRPSEANMLQYFMVTDVILTLIFLLATYFLPISNTIKQYMLIGLWITVRLYDELVAVKRTRK